jgi:hypothetical protein
MYKGNIDDNWEPADRLMYHRLCTRFHGHYTDYPSRANQSQTFLDWLDKYKDPEYHEERSTNSVIGSGGVDLRQFLPDRQPVNTEGASKQEARARDAAVNGNARALQTPLKAPEPVKPIEQEAKSEDKNELPGEESVQSNSESRDETNSNGSNDSSASESNNGQDSTKELANTEQNSNAGSGTQETPTNPPRNTSPQTETARNAKPVKSGKPAPFVTGGGNSIKTR